MYQNIGKTRIGKLNENIIFAKPTIKNYIWQIIIFPQRL